MFVHVHWWHIAVNMRSLCNVMPECEAMFGSRLASAVYLSSGVVSGLLQYAYGRCTQPRTRWYAMGASGALAGIYGAVLTNMWLTNRATLASAVADALWTLVFPWQVEKMHAALVGRNDGTDGVQIGHESHLGGLAVGSALALALEWPVRQAATTNNSDLLRILTSTVFPLSVSVPSAPW